MSHPNNTKWIEDASDNLEEALEGEDFDTAELIIKDAKEKGFDEEAKKFEKRLELSRSNVEPDWAAEPREKEY